jgi:RND family efflux transporter MFP subunit
MNGRLLIKVLVFLVLCVVGSLVLLWLVRPEVSVVPAKKGLAEQMIPGTVEVLAGQVMSLESDVPGRVRESNLSLGQHVKEGAILVQLDPTKVQLDIDGLESEFKAAREKIAIGSATRFRLIEEQEKLENVIRLHERGSVSAADLARQQRVVQQTKDQLAMEKVNNQLDLERIDNKLKLKSRELDQMSIRSPVDGIVAEIKAYPGDLIEKGSPLATIISNERIVEAKISEEDFAELKLGQSAGVHFLGYGGNLFDATIRKILPVADSETQRYITHLEVDIDEELLVAGITGEVSIVTQQREDAIIIPRRALYGEEVFVVEGSRISLREVEVGFVGLTVVEVLSGVTEGELVVTDELGSLRDGDRVRLREEEKTQ